MTKDISASIRARLKNIAKEEQTDFNAVLTRYGLERLLYRIGQSEYANQYLLKGALLFNFWYGCEFSSWWTPIIKKTLKLSIIA